MKVGRLIHTTLDSHQLPTEWEHPAEKTRHEGAQVLSVSRALTIAEADEDSRDDWYRSGDGYDHLAIMDVSEKSGESGCSCYGAVCEGDIDAMYVIDLDSLEWALTDIWDEMLDEGYELPVSEHGFPPERWWADRQDEVIDRLTDKMDRVEPEFVDTLD